MKKTLIFLIVCLYTTGLMADPGDNPQRVSLTIKVKNLKKTKGQLLVAIFNAPDGFPGTAEKSYRSMIVEIKDNQVEIDVTGLRPGTYAVSIVHDENSNGKVDTNVFGIPTESFGFSNDAKGLLGPPKFDQARFEVSQDTVLTVTLN
jgi:uncharacterized protein (DUF2141 family)